MMKKHVTEKGSWLVENISNINFAFMAFEIDGKISRNLLGVSADHDFY
jgi:hypothetical protein